MVFKSFLLILTLFYCAKAQEFKKTIVFAPLPIKNQSIVVEEFAPLFQYLEKVLKIKTIFSHEKDYAIIIQKFKQNKIDIALLGPLPYLKLNKDYKFNQPIITFKQDDKNTHYRCVLAKYKNDKVTIQNQTKVALTQPLSTCGYYMTNQLMQKKYDISLKDQKFSYTMSHQNTLNGVLDGDFDIAGVKESIAKEYKTLGVEILAQSSLLPGFSLIANTKSLPKKQIEIIQNLILTIPKSTYSQWDGLPANGSIPADETTYNKFYVDFTDIPMQGNIQ